MDKNYVEVDGTVLVNLRDDTLSSASQVAEGVTAHLRTGQKVTGTGTGGNVLSGKILSVTGDSICYGASYSGGYAGIIGEENGMTVQNLGENGRCIADFDNKTGIYASIADMRSDADYILLEGGTNDTGDVQLGTITSGYTDTLNTSTFAGAFETMLKNAINKFHGKKIGYIFIPKGNPDFDSRTTGSYYNVAKACCEKWGVPYCDLNTLVPPIGLISTLSSTYTSDGVHPNELGYRTYWVPQITAWMKTL